MPTIAERIELAVIRHRHGRVASLIRYAKDEERKWITIGSHDGEGGTHVQVDGDGNITGGPEALKEKGITNLSHFGGKSAKYESHPSTVVDKPESRADTTPVAETKHEHGSKKMETATKSAKELDPDSAWWNKTATGQDVIRWEQSSHFPVKVGDVVSLGGRTVTVVKMGEPFKAKSGAKMVYLYSEEPVKRTFNRTAEESPDDPMERLEWQRQRGIGGGKMGDE